MQLSPPSARLHLYGSAAQGSSAGTRVKLDLAGLWPNLSGTASAQVAGLKEPISLTGDGSGSYALNAGALGSGTLQLDGFVPSLLASLHLTPLPLVGGTGDTSADLNLSGPLSALQLTARSSISSAEIGSVRVQNLNLSVAGPLTGQGAGLNSLTGTLSQSGRATGTLERGSLSFGDLRASGSGFQASTTGRVTLSGTGSAALTLTGPGVGADLKAAYAGGSVALSGTARATGFIATLNSHDSNRPCSVYSPFVSLAATVTNTDCVTFSAMSWWWAFRSASNISIALLRPVPLPNSKTCPAPCSVLATAS